MRENIAMDKEREIFGMIGAGKVKRDGSNRLTPGRMTEFENEKNNYIAPVIPLKKKEK
jgi:hypothetical protein